MQAAVAAALLGCAGLAPLRAESLAYTLTPLADEGLLQVEIIWETGKSQSSALGVPRQWGGVVDVPDRLDGVTIQGGSVERRGPLWVVRHAPRSTLRVRYRVRSASERLDWPRSHAPFIGQNGMHAFGSVFLLAPHDERGVSEREIPTVLRWKLPEGWDAACSWGAGKSAAGQLSPAAVRESVYLAGPLQLSRIESDGVRLEVATLGKLELSGQTLGERAAAILRAQATLLGDTALPPFVLTAASTGDAEAGSSRLAGLGLHQSFALLLSPTAKADDALDHLLSHELFHHWLGRTIRAAEPERQVAWFFEGMADYYALRALRDGGLWDDHTLARWVNRHVAEYAWNPAQGASNAEIEARFWDARDTVGAVAYQRGFLLGARWHALARKHGVKGGVDAWLRRLLADARRDATLVTNNRLRASAVETLGAWAGGEFDAYVVAAKPVELPPDAFAPGLVGKEQEIYEFELGFDRAVLLTKKRIEGLKPDSAAADAGLEEGDAVVGWSLRTSSEERCEIKVLRDDTVRTIQFYPRGRATRAMQFRVAAP